jgi:hypothetical protein
MKGKTSRALQKSENTTYHEPHRAITRFFFCFLGVFSSLHLRLKTEKKGSVKSKQPLLFENCFFVSGDATPIREAKTDCAFFFHLHRNPKQNIFCVTTTVLSKSE